MSEAAELLEHLVKACGKRDDVGDRYAYHAALMTVASFLRSNRQKDCASWIENLARQLHDAELTGIVGPALQPDKNPGNTLSGLDHNFRLRVAAGVKALIMSDMSRDDAAKEAIRKVASLKNTSPKIILSWMDEQGRKRRHGGERSRASRFLYGIMVKVAKTDPKLLAEVYFDQANELFQQANELGISLAL